MKQEKILAMVHSARFDGLSNSGTPVWEIFWSDRCEFLKTSGKSDSAYACDLSKLKYPAILKLGIHQTPGGKWIVDSWESSGSSGLKLEELYAARLLAVQAQAVVDAFDLRQRALRHADAKPDPVPQERAIDPTRRRPAAGHL